MNSFDNHRLQGQKYKTVAIIVAGIVLACAVIFILFPRQTANPIASQQIQSPLAEESELNLTTEPQPVPSQIAPPPPAEEVPDYSIPPIANGMVPVITNISTDQNVVFLGIDDGAFKDQSVVDMMQENHIKASLYLVKSYVSSNPDFFKQLVELGSIVENHTLSHNTKMVTDQTYDQQKAEICGMADYVEQTFGSRPRFFRPPGGTYSNEMRQAAADCGMKAIVTWIAKANGGSMQYQIGDKLRPGDVVLMHFRPEFKQDMQAFIDAMVAAGLHTELLEDVLSDG